MPMVRSCQSPMMYLLNGNLCISQLVTAANANVIMEIAGIEMIYCTSANIPESFIVLMKRTCIK